MNTLSTILRFNTQNFTLRVRAVVDDHVDLSWDDEGSVKKGLKDGSLSHFGVIVEVCHRQTGAILGEDSLWGCIEKSYGDFRKSGYFRNLVSEACRSARNTLSDLQSIKLHS